MTSYLALDQVAYGDWWPKAWVLSAQSAEPLHHGHAHDQEVLNYFWMKIACCFVWMHLFLHLLHRCMKNLFADDGPSHLFMC